MAASVQSLLASPVTARLGGQSRSSAAQFAVSSRLSLNLAQRKSVMKVRCMAPEDGTPTDPMKESAPQVNPLPKVEPAAPKPKPKVSTNFGDLFAFSGPAPERINGRLAMIGFVAAIAVEAAKGTDLFSQISDGGAQWFLGTSILLSVASLIPLFKGVRAEGKTEGLMNSNAELWNGRLAMVGLIALAFTEFVKGSALV